MAGDSIFLVADEGLIEMSGQPFESEDALQALLAAYPNLLPGGQLRPSGPLRWLLVRRELGVPDGDGMPNRWSLDHLFIDQDCIPTLVEVKRSTDTRLRREVVGQMLDYAANGSSYWPPGTLRAALEARCTKEGLEREVILAEHLEGASEDDFWAEVDENVSLGRVRMVFLADVIPPELRRIIEFLDEQLVRAEVIGVEVRQYVGDGGRQTLVPRVVARSEAAREVRGKGTTPRRTYEQLLRDATDTTQRAETCLLTWGKANHLEVRQSPAAMQFLTQAGAGVCQFFPGYDAVEIAVEHVRQVSPTVPLDEFLASLRRVCKRRPPSSMYPNILCADLLEDWEGGGRPLLDTWLGLVERSGTQRIPFTYG